MAGYGMPTDYDAEAKDIERRRKYAEALQAQSMQPLETQMAGGWAIPIAPTQGLAKALQAYKAKEKLEKAKLDAANLSSRRNQALADALKGMPSANTVNMNPVANDDEGNPMPPALKTTQPTFADNARWMGSLAQIGPDAVGIGSSLLGLQQKATEGEENRAARLSERLIALDAAAQNAALTREERATRAAEASQLRRELQQSQQNFAAEQARQSAADRQALARQAAADRAANRPVQPLVQVMGPNGQPMWVERADAVGKVPAGAGSKAEATSAGKADVDTDVMKLKTMLDTLKAGGGIVDTSKGALSNIGAAIGASGIGQTLSGAVGTKNQSARNEMNMIRPSLLRSIMQSTGMSAKQMDSNAELKLWLSTATDPTKDYQANLEALNNIATKYGSGPIIDSPTNVSRGASGSFDGPPPGAVRRK